MEHKEERSWLAKRYRPAPSSGPSAKRVKVSSIKNAIESHFSRKYEHTTLSSIIHATFLSTDKKPASHDRTMHMFGMEEIPSEEVVLPDVEDEDKEQLKARIRELENTVTELKLRVSQLEEQLQATLTATSSLTTQADLLLHDDLSVYHGPNKICHFEEFSLESVRSDLKHNAPSLYQLFTSLSRSTAVGDQHNSEDDDMKAITSLSVLLKSRSVKVLGLQLLIGMMLVGRATSRRVRFLYMCIH